MQTIIKNQNWQDQQALERYKLIAPLLDESIDPAKRSQMRNEIAERAQISERTCIVMKRHTKPVAFRD